MTVKCRGATATPGGFDVALAKQAAVELLAHANERTDKKGKELGQAHLKMKGRSGDDAKEEKEAAGPTREGNSRGSNLLTEGT